MRAQNGDSAEFVWNKAAFDAVDPDNTDYLLGKDETKSSSQ
jgi:hypothetical protein